MHRSAIGGGFILFAAVTIGLSAPATAEAQALAQVFVEVLDADGQVVPDLSVNDFILQEDDTQVNIVSAERVGPMKVALLVDNGDRMWEMSALNPLREGLEGFFDALGPEHEVSLFTIAPNTQLRVDFTTDREELKESAGSLFVDQGAGVLMLDGIREVWERRYEDDELFPVIVLVLSDSIERSSHYTGAEYRKLIEMLVNNGVTVSILQLSGRRGGALSQYASNITENTGGMYETMVAATGLAQRLPTFAERLNAHHAEMAKRYRVRYEAPDPRGAQISAGARAGVNIRLFAGLRIEQ